MSSNYIVFDVETTGLPKNYKASPKLFKAWPHIVQFSWVLVDNENGNIPFTERNFIIKPDNYVIPEDSVKIHKITNKKAVKEGVALIDVLKIFKEDCDKVKTIIAHNASFDINVISAAHYRIKEPVRLFENKNIICTMKSTTKLCKLKGKYGYKYPKLEELYYFLFKEKPNVILHNSLEDVKVTLKCFDELTKRNINFKS